MNKHVSRDKQAISSHEKAISFGEKIGKVSESIDFAFREPDCIGFLFLEYPKEGDPVCDRNNSTELIEVNCFLTTPIQLGKELVKFVNVVTKDFSVVEQRVELWGNGRCFERFMINPNELTHVVRQAINEQGEVSYERDINSENRIFCGSDLVKLDFYSAASQRIDRRQAESQKD